MKKIVVFLTLLPLVPCVAQENGNRTIQFSSYLEWPTYIVNKDYVVYECDTIQRIIHPDMPSFCIPKHADFSGNISYKKLDKDYYVISGTDEGKILYHKTILSADKGLVSFELRYNEKEKEYYNTLTEYLSKTFKAIHVEYE